MDVGPDQAGALATMGIMTGETGPGLGREAFMAGQGIRLTMTAETKLVAIVFQELIVVGVMGLVTGRAFTIGKGLMLDRVLLFAKGLMAFKTTLGKGPAQQSLLLRGMGTVAGQALAIADRLVLYPLTEGPFGLIMTGVTEIPPFFLEKPLVFGNMGIMTLGALALGHRLMDNLAAELLLGVTADAALNSPGRSRGNRHERDCGKQYSKTNLHHFPSP